MSSVSLSSPSSAQTGHGGTLTARVRRLLVAWLGHPRAPRLILWTSAALMAFSLGTGLAADDYVHLWLLQGAPGVEGFSRAPWDIFRFTTPETTANLQAHGILSWWADPAARLAFLRPVSALTHYVDHLLWPTQAWAMHLHSLVWGVLVLAGVLALYRRLFVPGFFLGLSFYLYALDDARAWFVSWVAGRNTVVATAISLWVLVLYVRARQDRDGRALLLSLATLPVALLAGEGSVAICTYLFAHALWLETDAPLLRRLLRLWPYAAIVVVWRVLYGLAGYGASGSGLYADPASLEFVVAFLERAPILVFSQFGGAWSEMWSTLFVMPTIRLAIFVQAVASVVLYAYLFFPHFRQNRLLAFCLTGAVLCLVPASAAFPADRLLNWVAIGAAPAMAHLIDMHFGRPGRGFYGRLAAILAIVLVIVRVVITPPLLGSRARGANGLRRMLERVDASVPSGPGIRERTVVYMNPPAVPLAAYLPIMRGATGKPAPGSQIWLMSGTGDVTVERLGPRTLRLSSSVGLLENPASRLLRSRETPFHVGDTFEVGAFVMTVRAVDAAAMPIVVEARCDRQLGDPSLVLLAWQGTRYVPFALPAVGASTTLPAPDYLEILWGHRLPIDSRHPSADRTR